MTESRIAPVTSIRKASSEHPAKGETRAGHDLEGSSDIIPVSQAQHLLPKAIEALRTKINAPVFITDTGGSPSAVLLSYAEYMRLVAIAQNAAELEETFQGEVAARAEDTEAFEEVPDVDAWFQNVVRSAN